MSPREGDPLQALEVIREDTNIPEAARYLADNPVMETIDRLARARRQAEADPFEPKTGYAAYSYNQARREAGLPEREPPAEPRLTGGPYEGGGQFFLPEGERNWPKGIVGATGSDMGLPIVQSVRDEMEDQTIEEQRVGKAAQGILEQVRINPEAWEKFIREAPKSTNIEDRRAREQEMIREISRSLPRE